MRVLALTNLYPNSFQPQRATFNRHQFRLLGEQHAVRVVAPILWVDERRARRAGAAPLPRGRQVRFDGLTVDHPRYWYTPKVLRGLYGRFFYWSVRRTVRRIVDEFRPELLFTPWAYPDGWAAVRLAREAGLPVVIQVHGSDVRLVNSYAGRQCGTMAALRGADGIVAVSQELADRVISMGVDPDRVRVIVDGVDRDQFHAGDRAAARAALGWRPGVRHLLFVGNLVPVKGVDVLLDACARLDSQVGVWELHLVGDGPLRTTLTEQAARARLGDRVRFHGSQPHERLPDWYRAADLFVLPSRSEGIPNVLLESAACGTPYVATRVGGVPEIEPYGACRLVPPENPDQLAAAISESILTPSNKRSAGPRDRRDAVNELIEFLSGVNLRFRESRLGFRAAQPYLTSYR